MRWPDGCSARELPPPDRGCSRYVAHMWHEHTPWQAAMAYALRTGSRALLARSNLGPASGSQVAVGGNRWLLTVVRGHVGDTLGARQSCVGQVLGGAPLSCDHPLFRPASIPVF
jgi:hypothetical protein